MKTLAEWAQYIFTHHGDFTTLRFGTDSIGGAWVDASTHTFGSLALHKPNALPRLGGTLCDLIVREIKPGRHVDFKQVTGVTAAIRGAGVACSDPATFQASYTAAATEPGPFLGFRTSLTARVGR